MIIRGIHIENWRCIARLDLDELPGGLIVLYGPNRTGKSSLVKALRCCLFDCDHDTASKDIKKSIPWSSCGLPKVVVEFAAANQDYRLTKVYAKRGGKALLEKKNHAGWRVEEEAPKEASRKVQELLGATRSTAGLNQLLWLEQGDIALPDPGSLDAALEKQLVGVLGVLVTGRDLAFKQELDRRCSKWFTEKTGKFKQDSTVSQWERCATERQQRRDEEKEKFRHLEHAILQMEECEDSLPQRQKSVRDAATEVRELEKEAQRCQERLRRFQEVEKLHDKTVEALLHAKNDLDKYRAAQERGLKKESRVHEAGDAIQTLQEEKDRRAGDYERKLAALEAARQAEEVHQHGREDLADRRRLLDLLRQQERQEATLTGMQELADESAALEGQIKKITAPDDKALQELRANRRTAASRRAQLQAAALTLTIGVQRPVRIHLSVDGRDACPVELSPSEKKAWVLRQRAGIDIDGLGFIELARGQENLDLERSARELAELDHNYHEAVRAYHEQPADESCLDRLAEGRIRRETWIKRLEAIRAELQARAPTGRGALETEMEQTQNYRRIVLQRRPDLADWTPGAEDVEDRSRLFEANAGRLQKTRQQREAEEQLAGQALKKAENLLQQHKEQLAGLCAAAEASREELKRLGEEADFLSAFAQAEQARAKAESCLAENQLSEAERTVQQRLDDARTALEQRQERLRELEDQCLRLRTLLQGNEGLHTRLADAEASLQEAETNLGRARVEAEAHSLLRDLFEKCRESQVEAIMGPIAGRVLDWAQKIGLNDYQEVCFGDRFLPEGLVMKAGQADAGLALGNESYGTGEQLSLLVRLALGGVLARDEPMVAILDDPLAHADPHKHRRLLDVLRLAADGNGAWNPPAGRLQIIILTCHPDRFDHLTGARQIDLAQQIVRVGG